MNEALILIGMIGAMIAFPILLLMNYEDDL